MLRRMMMAANSGPPSGHSRWRIKFTASQEGNYVALAEIEFRASTGGANQASGGAASSNGQYDVPYGPGNAFDGIATTLYVSNIGLPKWVAYAFPSHVGVAEIAIRAVDSSYGVHTDDPKDFKLEWSDDGLTWTSVLSVTGQTGWGYGEWRAFSVP